MNEIETFVKAAREHNVDDLAIRKALEEKGWDSADIDAALSGAKTPEDEMAVQAPTPPATRQKTATLSPLMAAMHHILLWFFTSSSTVTIVGVIASLFSENVSADALAAMIAVTVVTFIPYAVLFAVFLSLDHKRKGVIPGKVWSIITICLHIIGAMAAAITLVVTAITSSTTSVMVGAGLVLLLNAIVITTYCFGAFSLTHVPKLRKVVISLHLPILVVLFGILSFLSIMQIGPAKHDDQLRQNMVTTVQKIVSYTKEHQALPANGNAIVTSPEIHYSKKSDTTYELCADFQIHEKAAPPSHPASSEAIHDDYVYKEQFTYYGKGQRCFTFKSNVLDQDYTLPDPVIDPSQPN